jgi:hypothetical protein
MVAIIDEEIAMLLYRGFDFNIGFSLCACVLEVAGCSSCCVMLHVFLLMLLILIDMQQDAAV